MLSWRSIQIAKCKIFIISTYEVIPVPFIFGVFTYFSLIAYNHLGPIIESPEAHGASDFRVVLEFLASVIFGFGFKLIAAMIKNELNRYWYFEELRNRLDND